jgi:hypothetical protein
LNLFSKRAGAQVWEMSAYLLKSGFAGGREANSRDWACSVRRIGTERNAKHA